MKHILIVSLVLTAIGSEQQPIKEALELCSAMASDEKAAPSCRKAIDEGVFESGWRLPETQAVYRRLGAAAESLGRFDDAVRVYRAGTRQYPDSPEFFARLGWLLLDYFDASAEAWGPLDQAIRLGSASKDFPLRARAQCGLAIALTAMKRPDQSKPACKIAKTLDASCRCS